LFAVTVFGSNATTGSRETLFATENRAHTGCRGLYMLSTAVDWKKKREELKAKRDPLFARYLRHPHDTSLALEIKIIDDQMAECNEQLQRKRPIKN
jgi:hypothetical protein